MGIRITPEQARAMGLEAPKRATRSKAQIAPEAFALLCKAHGVPMAKPEHRFHATRQWRFDWAWVEQRVAIEVHGGIWVRGGHSRGAGQLHDWEKINEAQLAGWRVFQFSPKQVKDGEAFAVLKRALSEPVYIPPAESGA